MDRLHDLVQELLVRYGFESDSGPGLIRRLDEAYERTTQPRQDSGSGTAGPGPRAPGPLEALDWSQRIKAEVVRWDMELRGSDRPQSWVRALRGLPQNAVFLGKERETTTRVGTWHSTALTVLGFRTPSVHFRGVQCLSCGEASIYGRADRDRPRAWCQNPLCIDGATGWPARYEGDRLWLLTRNTTTERKPA